MRYFIFNTTTIVEAWKGFIDYTTATLRHGPHTEGVWFLKILIEACLKEEVEMSVWG